MTTNELKYYKVSRKISKYSPNWIAKQAWNEEAEYNFSQQLLRVGRSCEAFCNFLLCEEIKNHVYQPRTYALSTKYMTVACITNCRIAQTIYSSPWEGGVGGGEREREETAGVSGGGGGVLGRKQPVGGGVGGEREREETAGVSGRGGGRASERERG